MNPDEIRCSDFRFEWKKPPPEMSAKGKHYTEPIQAGNTKYKFVKLDPGIHAGKHNHKGQSMEEWHFIISGTGWCLVYNKDGSTKEKARLEPGKFSPRFDSDSPDHEFINDEKEPLIFLAIERYF